MLDDRDSAPARSSCLRARPTRFVLVMVIVLVALAICSGASAGGRVTRLGSGANEVWVLRPAGPIRSIVVFAHGWSTPFPWQGFAAWIAHLRTGGNVVIYPRYRVSANASAASALVAFREALVTAFRRLGTQPVPVIALGKSFGASAVFYYATEARSWGVPVPTAVISVFPALPIDGVLPAAPLPSRDSVEIFVGDADTVAGSAGADAFWQWLAGHPKASKRYVLVRSRPGFVANHDSAQESNTTARRVFWSPVDKIIASARSSQAAK
jgi:acetyl esterase/lipase